MMKKHNGSKVFRIGVLFFGLGIITVCLINMYISLSTANQVYDETSEIPYNDVGLILGTAKHLKHDSINPYYTYRVEAAVKLYKSGKIKYILVSGDNSKTNYNETLKFKMDLIKNGIPENKIYMDFAGFRTLASVVRANKVFGLSSFTVISQKYHNERALFLTNQKDIEAVGFNAKNVRVSFSFRSQLREFFARPKAFLDIVFNVKPKFLGKPIKIPSD